MTVYNVCMKMIRRECYGSISFLYEDRQEGTL